MSASNLLFNYPKQVKHYAEMQTMVSKHRNVLGEGLLVTTVTSLNTERIESLEWKAEKILKWFF